MTTITPESCPQCGNKIHAEVPVEGCAGEGVVVVTFDPSSTRRIVLVNSESGARQEVDLSGERSSNLNSRHIAGIIGPY